MKKVIATDKTNAKLKEIKDDVTKILKDKLTGPVSVELVHDDGIKKSKKR